MTQAKEEIAYKGKILAIINVHQPNGEVWEIARRSPGVRVIIKNTDGTYKLSNEFRHEHNSHGYRLAGGKMFDHLQDFIQFSKDTDEEKLLVRAKEDAIREAEEELGIKNPQSIRFLEKSVLGSTVEWDLYVFEISDFQQGKPNTHGMEDIEAVDLTKEQIIDAIESGKFNEDRMVPIVLRYLKKS
jgi:8-oxo-dGTP pyrophosphatase MutT (NUDIX family)